ncbi:MAG: hypothetical protein HUJ72_12985 [Blautia sp.]|nr:hypothetical protein [Blautia sp.]
MDTLEILDELTHRARKDPAVRQKLLDTRSHDQPLDAFCKAAHDLGYDLYVMDLIDAGEDFYATMRRSTNGGGENSPKLSGEDDFYELFFAAIQ